MSDTVKIVIEIPKEVFEARKVGEISPWVTTPILDSVQNGTPLSEEDNTMEWIKINERYKAPDSMFQCSECGELNYVNDNYCPGCGRKYKPTRT